MEGSADSFETGLCVLTLGLDSIRRAIDRLRSCPMQGLHFITILHT